MSLAKVGHVNSISGPEVHAKFADPSADDLDIAQVFGRAGVMRCASLHASYGC